MTPEPAAAPGRGEALTDESLQASVQQDLYRLEAYREQLTALVRQQELLRMSLESHARAQETLEEMETMDEGREILLPIGAEAFIQATPRSKDKVLIGVGSGVVAELDRSKALEILSQRRSQLEKSETSLLNQVRKVESEANSIQTRVQAIYQQAQAQSEADARAGTHVHQGRAPASPRSP